MKQRGVGVRGQERVEVHFFSFSTLPACLSCPPVCTIFGGTPLCELGGKKTKNSGLLKQADQVELRYCKRSPPGVSHFQGPHEHMRHSCETAETERGWVYETATDTSFHTRKLI